MNNKLNLEELVQQLESEQLRKKDFVVPVKCLTFSNGKVIITNLDNNDGLNAILANTGIAEVKENLTLSLDPLQNFHDQICSKLQIPRAYYERMLGKEILDYSVNFWLREQKDKNYFIRSFVNESDGSGVARAFLSDRYTTVDNFDVLLATLEAVKSSGVDLKIQNASITDTKMYVRFIAEGIERQAPELLKNYVVPGSGNRDNGICSGFVISNSEIGLGSFTVSPRVIIKACNNGMIIHEDNFSRKHVGSKMDEYSSVNWSDDTKKKNQSLIIAQVKDCVRTFTSQDYLGQIVSKFSEAAATEIEKPVETIELVNKECSFSELEKQKILNYFIQAHDNSVFGLNQAMTFYAHKDANADRQFELEKVAVEVCVNPTKYV